MLNQTSLCPSNSVCVNTIGSYTCSCADGFQSQGLSLKNLFKVEKKLNFFCKLKVAGETSQTISCTDINECALSTAVCGNLTCQNTIGSFSCLCPNGLLLVNGQCIVTTTPSVGSIVSTIQSQSTTTTAKGQTDNTGLILSIVLPILAVLVIAGIAGAIAFICLKMFILFLCIFLEIQI